MYNIQKIFKNINPETYNVSNIKYGDIGYIFINKGVKFKNLIKITIEEIFEVNEDGIVVTGYSNYFDNEGSKQKKEYRGIFIYKLEEGFILTSEGYKLPVLTDKDYELLDYDYILDKKSINWEFSFDKFFIELNISGDIYFTDDEINKYLNNIKFDFCIAKRNQIVLGINDIKIIYEDAIIKYKNKTINYDMFFNYLCENYESDNNVIYNINKEFYLYPEKFIVLEY